MMIDVIATTVFLLLLLLLYLVNDGCGECEAVFRLEQHLSPHGLVLLEYVPPFWVDAEGRVGGVLIGAGDLVGEVG